MSNNSSFKIENLFNVKDWVVVVTGAGSGIGLMCAQAFANNGARVYIVGRTQEKLDQAVKAHGQDIENGGQLIPITSDTTSKESIKDLVDKISTKEDHVDCLVNNAGINTSHRQKFHKGDEDAQALYEDLWGATFEEWEAAYRTNVAGYYFTTVAFIPLLAAATKARHGHSACVINNASMSGTMRSTQNHIQYNVSKSATTHLNTLLAQELRRPGVKIRVNAFSPGYFPSEMSTKSSGEDQKSHIPVEGFGENKGVPAGRPGKDDDIAQLVLMLAVNTYVNGQNVIVDGGWLLENP